MPAVRRGRRSKPPAKKSRVAKLGLEQTNESRFSKNESRKSTAAEILEVTALQEDEDPIKPPAKRGRKPKAAMKPSRAYLEDHKEVKPKPLEKPLCFPIAPFKRLILEILSTVRKDHYEIDDEAVEAIQTEAEEFLSRIFQTSRIIALQAGRTLIKLEDINAVREVLKVVGANVI